MNAQRFDKIAQVFANRQMSRRVALSQAGAAAVGIGAAGLTTGFASAHAQSATPEASAATPKEFLFVQSFESGTLEPLVVDGAATPSPGGAEYTLTLSQGLGQTIFFSDRPERVVGTVPTPRFLDALGFTPENPPNAALVASTGDENEEILVVELFSPNYDETTRTVTYGVRILDDFDQVNMTFTHDISTEPKPAASYGVSNLFVDDCSSGYIRCFNNTYQDKTLGDIAVDRCWIWDELCCFPCSTGNDFAAMAAVCNSVFGDQCDPNDGCSGGNLGSCG